MFDLLKEIGILNSPLSDDRMAQNYRRHGAALGCAGFDEFVKRAEAFYDEALTALEDGKTGYTCVELGKRRILLDYNSLLRGVYTRSGKPVAFFKPDFKAAGFSSAAEELAALKHQGPVVRA